MPNGTYNVALTFAEIYFTTTAQRVMNAAINGATVLSNLPNPHPTQPLIRTFPVTHRVDYLTLTSSTTFFEGPPLHDLVHHLATQVPGALERCPAPLVRGYEVFRVDRDTLARLPEVPEPKARVGSGTESKLIVSLRLCPDSAYQVRVLSST